MTDFVLSPLAAQDLHEIWDYIAQDNLDAADRVRDELYDAMARLSEMLTIGHLREELADEKLRVWTVRSYLIIYRPTSKPLQIIRVVSGYRDLAMLFDTA